jgi:N-acetylglucosaminyldiphosphoundecaprenol N-acetyl-beta-D-mannosaminyltransferase
VADQAAHKLSERYPNLQIVGTHHGYFRPSESDRITELIEAAQPDMVLVGLGVPRQELWMRANRQKIRTAVLMGVGGCFDVWAGARRRAPRSWQRVGLEWLYRLLQEPRRLVRVSTIPLFVGQIALIKLAQLASD